MAPRPSSARIRSIFGIATGFVETFRPDGVPPVLA